VAAFVLHTPHTKHYPAVIFYTSHLSQGTIIM
jgi:hypothetical protein